MYVSNITIKNTILYKPHKVSNVILRDTSLLKREDPGNEKEIAGKNVITADLKITQAPRTVPCTSMHRADVESFSGWETEALAAIKKLYRCVNYCFLFFFAFCCCWKTNRWSSRYNKQFYTTFKIIAAALS